MLDKRDSQSTVEAIRSLLRSGNSNSQEEICDRLVDSGIRVTQSTVSRALKRLGAVRTIRDGRWVYELPTEMGLPPIEDTFAELVTEVQNNSNLIVVKCRPGAAPLIARYLDHYISQWVMGTIAGDDAIFIAPKNIADTQQIQDRISSVLHL
jgi:transcriptional regulator of arginine metabolism